MFAVPRFIRKAENTERERDKDTPTRVCVCMCVEKGAQR